MLSCISVYSDMKMSFKLRVSWRNMLTPPAPSDVNYLGL